MVLKRKRSDSEISTTSSILSSALSSSNFMSLDSFNTPQIQTPSLFSSRTRKRYRDNRPDENSVHRMSSLTVASDLTLTSSAEHTLNLLFSAQQNTQSQSHLQQQLQSSPFSSQAPVSSLPSSTQSSDHQSSLHSFWAISSARSSSPSSVNSSSSSLSNTPNTASHATSYFQPTNCEDCDTSLVSQNDGDSMDVDMMMDIDKVSGAHHACSACGKMVCYSCAVSNLGAERKCLSCAGKKKWEGRGGVIATMFRRVSDY
jgi:hypothetical protein